MMYLKSQIRNQEIFKRKYSLISLGLLLSFIFSIALISCKKDPLINTNGQIYIPTPFALKLPDRFPPMKIPSDNPLTVEGIDLGRRLFYEPMLSGDNTQSCASCHIQSEAFVEKDVVFSKGITGALGTRNTMPIFNLGYNFSFLWDGKAKTLEDQIKFPITADFEMNEDTLRLIKELKDSKLYPGLFSKAFPNEEINMKTLSKAIAQFMRIILSSNPKTRGDADGKLFRNAAEQRGFEVFIDEKKGDCFHCHEVGNPFLSTFRFENNGLDNDFTKDPGLFLTTGMETDKGKFKVPSLLNLKHTAPYMHDGRFKTLEEVIDFYDTGLKHSQSLNPNILKHLDAANGFKPIPREWTIQDKQDLIVFLKSLEDTSLLSNKNFSKP